MGATDFMIGAAGRTAKEAFSAAREKALWDHGHAGYTGTIAEKTTFVTIAVPEGREPKAYADELMDENDRRISDKWGPAGCIKVAEGRFVFFGFASC